MPEVGGVDLSKSWYGAYKNSSKVSFETKIITSLQFIGTPMGKLGCWTFALRIFLMLAAIFHIYIIFMG